MSPARFDLAGGIEPRADGSPTVVWEDGGPPRSRRYGDIYFSAHDGLAESRTVFLAGCGLPEAWAGRPDFTVAELGFGSGLNITALLRLWSSTRAPSQSLHVLTVESDPLSAAEATRALAAWPELAPEATLITDRWPGRARGFHRLDLPELSATIDVAILEAAEALGAWRGLADAWFLDGFAPALTAGAADDLWRPEVFGLIAGRSAPGARLATYTVAGDVRRGLAAAGFEIFRRPGHGRKRERLEARWPGPPRIPAPRPRAGLPSIALPSVAIIGAGVAGAALARAFRALGAQPLVFDQTGPGAGASGGPAALAAPRLDAGLGHAAALFAQAIRRAATLYEVIPGAILARGALQLAQEPKDQRRFAAIAGAWLGPIHRARVEVIEPGEAAWRLFGAGGRILAEAEVVCLARGSEAGVMADGLALTPVRGQATFSGGVETGGARLFGGYAIPAPGGMLFGATHDRGDTDPAPRLEDRARNLASVRAVLPKLAARLAASDLRDWSAVRATTQDYLPLAGAPPGAAAGLFALTGLGSRGFCLAPLLAEHIAALALDRPSPLPGPLADIIDPGRFDARAARKGRPRNHRNSGSGENSAS